MVSSKLVAYASVDQGEQAHIEALASGALPVHFEVTQKFRQYFKGSTKNYISIKLFFLLECLIPVHTA